jgi:hypothetical protein
MRVIVRCDPALIDRLERPVPARSKLPPVPQGIDHTREIAWRLRDGSDAPRVGIPSDDDVSAHLSRPPG